MTGELTRFMAHELSTRVFTTHDLPAPVIPAQAGIQTICKIPTKWDHS
jgi:hypothetical protein